MSKQPGLLFHQNLAAGRVLRHTSGQLIRVRKQMQGFDGSFEHINRHGERDKRFAVGWSGRLEKAQWKIERSRLAERRKPYHP